MDRAAGDVRLTVTVTAEQQATDSSATTRSAVNAAI